MFEKKTGEERKEMTPRTLKRKCVRARLRAVDYGPPDPDTGCVLARPAGWIQKALIRKKRSAGSEREKDAVPVTTRFERFAAISSSTAARDVGWESAIRSAARRGDWRGCSYLPSDRRYVTEPDERRRFVFSAPGVARVGPGCSIPRPPDAAARGASADFVTLVAACERSALHADTNAMSSRIYATMSSDEDHRTGFCSVDSIVRVQASVVGDRADTTRRLGVGG